MNYQVCYTSEQRIFLSQNTKINKRTNERGGFLLVKRGMLYSYNLTIYYGGKPSRSGSIECISSQQGLICSPNDGKGTGVVNSVPSDSHDDWMALFDLKNQVPLRNVMPSSCINNIIHLGRSTTAEDLYEKPLY